MRLLVCVAFHYSDHNDYSPFMAAVLSEFLDHYTPTPTIFVDTNNTTGEERVRTLFPAETETGTIRVFVHDALQHPYHLTWVHRSHVFQHIDDYDAFMYTECDMLVPHRNFVNYMENFSLVWPDGVPVLFRVEKNPNGDLHSSDAETPQVIDRKDAVVVGGKTFVNTLVHPLPYHALWICPQKVLKSMIGPDFVRVEISRERAASFLIWEMRQKGHLEMEGAHVSPLCYAFHLPNNYASVRGGRLGQVRVEDAVRITD